MERETNRLIPILESAGADSELAKAWRIVRRLLAPRYGSTMRPPRSSASSSTRVQAAGDARRRGRPAPTRSCSCAAPPRRRLRSHAAATSSLPALVDRQAEALTLLPLAHLRAMTGSFAEARELYRHGQGVAPRSWRRRARECDIVPRLRAGRAPRERSRRGREPATSRPGTTHRAERALLPPGRGRPARERAPARGRELRGRRARARRGRARDAGRRRDSGAVALGARARKGREQRRRSLRAGPRRGGRHSATTNASADVGRRCARRPRGRPGAGSATGSTRS